MTKQGQIEKIQEIINDCYVVDSFIAAEGSEGGYIDTEEAAKAIVEAGYGNILEYKAEIERLKAEVKQAKIDTLNKVKDVLDNAPNGWAYTTYIDELIEEIEKQ